VDQVLSRSLDRLGVLLAGGGAPCRRALAAADPESDVVRTLARSGLSRAVLARVRRAAAAEAPRVVERVTGAGWRWVIPGERDYPALLNTVADPPVGLFVRGTVPTAPAVAVVGSRRSSAYGRQVARMLGGELATGGVAVVSGMARGVDAAAHAGALDAGGPTVAVWGTGPDRVYPPEHRRLAEAIARSGALVTEYPPATPPRRYHFPERNRIVAGMTRAVVVVEAAARSGALVTARLALDEGREVLAVPGSILSELSAGPNALLRLGARPVLAASDVAAALGLELTAVAATEPAALDLVPPGEALTVDEIARRGDLDVQAASVRLLDLEMAGLVERGADGRYSRRSA
jgi:DNA processing protein